MMRAAGPLNSVAQGGRDALEIVRTAGRLHRVLGRVLLGVIVSAQCGGVRGVIRIAGAQCGVNRHEIDGRHVGSETTVLCVRVST